MTTLIICIGYIVIGILAGTIYFYNSEIYCDKYEYSPDFGEKMWHWVFIWPYVVPLYIFCDIAFRLDRYGKWVSKLKWNRNNKKYKYNL